MKKLFKKAEKSGNAKEKKRRNLRKLRYGATSTALTVVVIAAVLILNVIVGVIADRYPISIDLSKDQIFTLSEESVKVAKQITGELEIVVFNNESAIANSTAGSSSGIAEFDTAMREFYNALRQYRSESGGKVSFSFVDPDQEPTKFAKYSDYEVEAGDVLFLYEGKSKICSLDDMYNLDTSNYSYYGTYDFESKVEKTLASTIYGLTSGQEHVVQVLAGHEEDSNVISGLKSIYELNGYTFKENIITGSAEFDKDAEIMLIAAPAKDYSAAEIQRIQQWYYNEGNYGRHLMVYVHPTASCPNLYEFLKVEYQIQVEDELILETDLDRVFNYNAYYAKADVETGELTPNSAGTGNVLTFQARRLTTTLEEKASDGSVNPYGVTITSYPESANLIKLENLTSQSGSDDTTYAAAEDEYPLTSMIAHIYAGFNNNTQEAVDGSVVVSGCPYMTYSQITSNNTLKNEELLLDTFNTMVDATDAITVSTKDLTAETVSFSSGAQLGLGIGLFTVGLPIILLVVCLIVFIRRKNL